MIDLYRSLNIDNISSPARSSAQALLAQAYAFRP
jgi:hypothetical protein